MTSDRGLTSGIERLLAQDRQRLAGVLPDLFGYYLVQAGGWGSRADLCDDSRILNRFVTGHDLLADAEALPLAADSVDVVVLPHTLEFAQNPHDVLREAHRALVAEGHLVVLGFNPWSAWGLWRLFLGDRDAPWSGRFIAEGRLRDWLALLGFEVIAADRGSHALPFGSGPFAEWLDGLGERGWPLPAGAYMLAARKKVIPMTPIRPKWTREKEAVSGMPQPTANVSGVANRP